MRYDQQYALVPSDNLLNHLNGLSRHRFKSQLMMKCQREDPHADLKQ